MGELSYLISFIEGFLTFISPCILPLLPVYIFYLAGNAAENSSNMEYKNKKRLLVNSLGCVAGFSIIFIILGATATSLGAFLKSQIILFQKLSGIVMILFGLNFIGIIRIGFLNHEKRLNFKFNRLNFINSLVFGIVFAFGWTPCAGQFLGTALLLAANSQTLAAGILLLAAYSAGLGLPFVIVALLFQKLEYFIKGLQKHAGMINIISGIILILSGILVFTGNLQYLSNILNF